MIINCGFPNCQNKIESEKKIDWFCIHHAGIPIPKNTYNALSTKGIGEVPKKKKE